MSDLALFATGYGTVGCLVSAITLVVFPPHEHYRPPFMLRVFAATMYVVLWPALALMAAIHLSLLLVQRYRRGWHADPRPSLTDTLTEKLTDKVVRPRFLYRSVYEDH